MKRLNRFRGKIEFDVNKEHIVLTNFIMNDVFDMIELSKNKKNELLNGVSFFSNILYRSYPNESLEDLNQFILTNYSSFVDGLVISLGWATKKKLDNIKNKKDNKKTSLALFKARMTAEADSDTIENKYITNCYIIMAEFKYTLNDILKMPASTFTILIDEMIAKNKKEKEELNKSKTLK